MLTESSKHTNKMNDDYAKKYIQTILKPKQFEQFVIQTEISHVGHEICTSNFSFDVNLIERMVQPCRPNRKERVSV